MIRGQYGRQQKRNKTNSRQSRQKQRGHDKAGTRQERRINASLATIENLRGICKAGIKFAIEIDGQRKPALEGVATFLYYFK